MNVLKVKNTFYIPDTNDGLNDGSDSMTDGNTLPSTAINMFNMITIGFILVASGDVLYFVRRKQKQTQS